ncbi:exonuclease [Candidatus Woesearchaeota archaeon]|nr:MAG: exonuclease [Candidatus Woesearchaeota archaeon ex4484_78]RLE46845.1 MAG: exonuclease [Candidatus Woesearchaeota archaeon]
MLEQSFIFLPKVGERTEKKIWSTGIKNWTDFITTKKIKGLTQARKEALEWNIKHAKKAKKEENIRYFHYYFPQKEHWRLWNEYKDEALFLDIETNGYYGGITVVGLYDRIETKSLVRGFNLHRRILQKEIAKYKMIVTFNGRSFDIPVLKKYFNIDFEMPHIDLRFVCQRLGYTGGLKKIEEKLGIKREKEIQGMTGEDAVTLWHLWRKTGDKEHLEKIVKYNEEDIVNLLPLAKQVIPLLWKKTRSL